MDPKDRHVNAGQVNAGQRNEGEGNKTAARHYNRAATEFANSGKVEEKAEEARRAVEGKDADRLRKAENAGLRKARH